MTTNKERAIFYALGVRPTWTKWAIYLKKGEVSHVLEIQRSRTGWEREDLTTAKVDSEFLKMGLHTRPPVKRKSDCQTIFVRKDKFHETINGNDFAEWKKSGKEYQLMAIVYSTAGKNRKRAGKRYLGFWGKVIAKGIGSNPAHVQLRYIPDKPGEEPRTQCVELNLDRPEDVYLMNDGETGKATDTELSPEDFLMHNNKTEGAIFIELDVVKKKELYGPKLPIGD